MLQWGAIKVYIDNGTHLGNLYIYTYVFSVDTVYAGLYIYFEVDKHLGKSRCCIIFSLSSAAIFNSF